MAGQQARKQQSVDTRDPIEVLKQEKFLTVEDIARALGTRGRPWTLRKARDWLIKSGIGFQLIERPEPDPVTGKRGSGKHGGPWYTTIQRLMEHRPEIVHKVHEERLEREETEDDPW